jgi:large subunit ribosomal protein L22
MKVQACLRMVRVGSRKLNEVASLVRRKNLKEAFHILKGVHKKAALDVIKVLRSAQANASHNHGMLEEKLFVDELTVGKSLVLRRREIRGRGRSGVIKKEFSQIRAVLVEG